MIKLDFLSKTLCCCNVIFEIKYPRGESEDLHSYRLPMVPTFMIPDLENHRNVKNSKNSISQENNIRTNHLRLKDLFLKIPLSQFLILQMDMQFSN